MYGSLTQMREDDFVDVEKIQDGGYGSVYRGKHRELGYLVALKKLKATNGKTDDRFRADLVKEISMLERIRHPHIVYVYGCINQPDCIALVMELAEYGSLKDFLATLQPQQPPVSLIVRMMHQIVLGMVFLHSQSPSILHLDLKAGNILVTNDLTIKITDFGLSEWRQYKGEHTTELMLSRDAVMRGTLTHVPPEKLKDLNVVPGKKYDVYGFAVLSWELASSKRAFGGTPSDLLYSIVPNGQRPGLEHVHRDLPPAILQVIQDCWHTNPLDRPDFTDIKRTTEDVLQRYKSTISTDEIALKNILYQRKNRDLPDVQPLSSGCPVPVTDTRPVKANGGSSTHPKSVDAVQTEPVDAGIKSSPGPQKVDNSMKVVRSDVGVERHTDTLTFNTDLSAVKPSSRAGSAASLPSAGDPMPRISSLQLDGPSTSSADRSTVFPAVATTVPGPGKATGLTLELDAAPPPSQDLQPPAAAAATRGAGRAAGTPGSGPAAQRPGSGTAASSSAIGGSGSLRGSAGGNHSVPSLRGPNSQLPQQQQQQRVPSASMGYPQYVPHQGGFLYYPCPGVAPVFLNAVDGKIPPGMPPAGSMFPPGSTAQPNSRTVIDKNGTTHIIQSGGVSSTQIGNKNIMYIGSMPGIPGTRPGSGATTQPSKTTFDRSKITKSKRKIADDDMELLADHLGNSWKMLARKLKFTEGQIDGFDHDHKTLFEKIYNMLLRWRQSLGDDATLDKVVSALCDIQKPDVAAQLPNDEPTGSRRASRTLAAGASGELARAAGGSAPNRPAAVQPDVAASAAAAAGVSSTIPAPAAASGSTSTPGGPAVLPASAAPVNAQSSQDRRSVAVSESLDNFKSKTDTRNGNTM